VDFGLNAEPRIEEVYATAGRYLHNSRSADVQGLAGRLGSPVRKLAFHFYV